MPQVDILYAHESWDARLIMSAVQNGAKGLVLAGSGAGDTGSFSANWTRAAMAMGIPVVTSTRINVGTVDPDSSNSSISSYVANLFSTCWLKYQLNRVYLQWFPPTFEESNPIAIPHSDQCINVCDQAELRRCSYQL